MNVYKMKGQACGGPLKTEVKELKGDLRPAPPYPSRVKTVDKGTQVTPEREAVRKQTDSPVPPFSSSFNLSREMLYFVLGINKLEHIPYISVTHCLLALVIKLYFWHLTYFINLRQHFHCQCI